MAIVTHLVLSGKTRNLMSEVGMAQTARNNVQIGMGATICMHSDRHAGTVVSIDQKRGMFSVQRDKATRTDKNGCSESQDYDYTRDPNGALYLFKFNKKTNRVDEYVTNQSTGRFNKVKCGCGLIIGDRDEYYDFSF